MEDETPLRYAHADIRTQVVMIFDPMNLQLDHRGVENGMSGIRNSVWDMADDDWDT